MRICSEKQSPHAFPIGSPHLAIGPNLSCVKSYLWSPPQTALPRAGPPPAAQSPRRTAILRGRSMDMHESIHSYPEERFEKASQCRRPRHFRQNFFPPDHHWASYVDTVIKQPVFLSYIPRHGSKEQPPNATVGLFVEMGRLLPCCDLLWV